MMSASVGATTLGARAVPLCETRSMMLKELNIYAVLPAQDLKRARAFFSEKLGLEPTAEHEGVLIYTTANGTPLQVYETGNAGTAQNTQMGWSTADLVAEVAALTARGVVFEEYDFPGLKTVDGIADLGGERAAWFKDSEGNTLCVSQTL
jgi:catechol 2,3-dioxygenase-like lactoylglutathione lyase family enzyme